MPKIYRDIEQKRFNELDEADKNIWSRVVKDEGKAVEQFDNPIKFQSKFERITAYTLQKLLEDLRNDLSAVIDDYNTGELEQTSLGKIILHWNTAVSYLKNIIMRGSISNRDIEKINSMLDGLKPLVSQVLTIAEEYKFVDIKQIRELSEKFDGNDWSPITSVSTLQNVNDLVQDLPEILLEDADINPRDDDIETVYRKLVDTRKNLRELIDNIPRFTIDQLKDLYRHYIKDQTRNISKSKISLDLLNKLEPMLENVNATILRMEAENEEEDIFYDAEPGAEEDDEKHEIPLGVVDAGVFDGVAVREPEDADDDFGFGGLYGMGNKLNKKQKMKKMKVKKSNPPLQYNDLLNDAYLFQGIE